MRSNRALYRSCPKHTKLLVSKAIVQAVQQQDPPGRFLEMSKKDNGLWRPIPYKRAVDKTSQALRERELPTPGEKGKESDSPKPTKAGLDVVGKKGPPKTLEDAGVALAGTEELKPQAAPKGQLPALSTGPGSAVAGVALESKKRKVEPTQFVKPSWWTKGAPSVGDGVESKRAKHESREVIITKPAPVASSLAGGGSDDEPDPVPLPTQPLQTRQSSMFRFLSQTGIFGSKQKQQQQQKPTASMGGFAFTSNSSSAGSRGSAPTTNFNAQMQRQAVASNPSFNMQFQQQPQMSGAAGLSGQVGNMAMANSVQQQQQGQQSFEAQLRASQIALQQQQQQRASLSFKPRQSLRQGSMAEAAAVASAFDAQMQQQESLLASSNFTQQFNARNGLSMQQQQNMNGGYPMQQQQQQDMFGDMDPFMDLQPTPLSSRQVGAAQFAQGVPTSAAAPQQSQQQEDEVVPPPMNRLTTQVSDWLNSFWPLGKEEDPRQQAQQQAPKQDDAAPPPPTTTLEPGISSTLFKLASTPSRLFTNLKSGVTAYFEGSANGPSAMAAPPPPPSIPGNIPPPPIIGTAAARRSSLLDDYEETAQETALRSVTSR